jgi:hypothetical protein
MEKTISETGKETELYLEIRFLNSFKFTLASLDKLASKLTEDKFKILEQFAGNNPLLKKKGIFPYEFMDIVSKN